MYITINSQEIYYQKLGSGKDLIMLHGWKQDVSSFHNVAEELKKHFTLYLIDLPGFGRSENPKKPFTVSDYSEIIYQFIRKLKLKKPALLGHSHGGRVAIKLASIHPEILGKLILEDAAGIRPRKDLGAYAVYFFAKTFHFLMPNFFNLKNKLRRNFYKRLQSDYLDALDLKKTLINVINEDLSQDLPKIKNETLLIWGENDTNAESSLEFGKKMYTLIPNSKIVSLPDVGHFPHTENPQTFLYYVMDFLS